MIPITLSAILIKVSETQDLLKIEREIKFAKEMHPKWFFKTGDKAMKNRVFYHMPYGAYSGTYITSEEVPK